MVNKVLIGTSIFLLMWKDFPTLFQKIEFCEKTKFFGTFWLVF